MLIQLMKIEILQFLLQSKLIHLSVKMGMRLKLRFGVMDLLVMDVALNPLIQDFCLFVSLPSGFNNGLLLQFGYILHFGINNPVVTFTIPIAYIKNYTPLMNIQAANTNAPNAEGNPRANIVDLATVCFNANVNANKEGFYWLTIGF